MADKKESALGAVTDFAQARVLDASGASKNIDKATMASVLAGQLGYSATKNFGSISAGATATISGLPSSCIVLMDIGAGAACYMYLKIHHAITLIHETKYSEDFDITVSYVDSKTIQLTNTTGGDYSVYYKIITIR